MPLRVRHLILASLVGLMAGLCPATAATRAECPDNSGSSGKLKISRTWDPKSGACSVWIKQEPDARGRSRSYTVSSTGLFMLVSTFGKGARVSTFETVRAYFLFPRASTPSWKVLTSGEVQVRTAAGQLVRFHPDSALVRSFTGISYEQSKEYDAPQGGLELLSASEGLILDTGSEKGGMPYANSSGSSILYGSASGSEINACKIPNHVLFTTSKALGTRLKHETDRGLHDVLSGDGCPTVQLGSLLRKPASPPSQGIAAADETPRRSSVSAQ